MNANVRDKAVWLSVAARRALLANSAGFRQTIQGHTAIRRTRRQMAGRCATTDPAALARASEFARSGVLRFEDPESTALVSQVASSFQDLIADDDACRDKGPAGHPSLHRYVTHSHLRIPDITSLLTPAVARTIEADFGSWFRVRSVRAYRNTGVEGYGPDSELYGNQWHLDPQVTCDLRYFVYLNDTSVPNGALETIDRPQTVRILRSGFVDARHVVGPARRRLAQAPVAHEGPAGTGVLVNAEQVLHRAGTCHPGRHRDMVQFWITPSAEPLPADWGAQLHEDGAFVGRPPGDG